MEMKRLRQFPSFLYDCLQAIPYRLRSFVINTLYFKNYIFHDGRNFSYLCLDLAILHATSPYNSFQPNWTDVHGVPEKRRHTDFFT